MSFKEYKMVELDFDKAADGLIPAIAQDWQTGQVLMVAYINKDAWEKTLRSGNATYWSRSRQQLWTKGETSGKLQKIHRIRVDCDLDAVLYIVEQIGGAACHLGYSSCFFRHLSDDCLVIDTEQVFDPAQVYRGKTSA